MFHSAEIRWFLKGDAPDAVREWFRNESLAVDEEPRVDEYLLLPGSASTGVKFRQYPGDDRASFEIKSRTSEPINVSFGDAASGWLDTWVKWSCRPTDVPSFRDTITGGENLWVFVEKNRCLRKFAIGGHDVAEVDPGMQRPADGCQFELTAIRSLVGQRSDLDDWEDGQSWWSLSRGLRNAGSANRLRAIDCGRCTPESQRRKA